MPLIDKFKVFLCWDWLHVLFLVLFHQFIARLHQKLSMCMKTLKSGLRPVRDQSTAGLLSCLERCFGVATGNPLLKIDVRQNILYFIPLALFSFLFLLSTNVVCMYVLQSVAHYWSEWCPFDDSCRGAGRKKAMERPNDFSVHYIILQHFFSCMHSLLSLLLTPRLFLPLLPLNNKGSEYY